MKNVREHLDVISTRSIAFGQRCIYITLVLGQLIGYGQFGQQLVIGVAGVVEQMRHQVGGGTEDKKTVAGVVAGATEDLGSVVGAGAGAVVAILFEESELAPILDRELETLSIVSRPCSFNRGVLKFINCLGSLLKALIK